MRGYRLATLIAPFVLFVGLVGCGGTDIPDELNLGAPGEGSPDQAGTLEPLMVSMTGFIGGDAGGGLTTQSLSVKKTIRRSTTPSGDVVNGPTAST